MIFLFVNYFSEIEKFAVKHKSTHKQRKEVQAVNPSELQN